MKRETLLKKLNRLPELYDQIRDYNTSDLTEQVERGIRTKEELEIWDKYRKIHSLAHEAKKEAEKALVRPDIMPHYPPEYQVLAKRQTELKVVMDLDNEVRQVLSCLREDRTWGGRPYLPFGLAQLAQKTWDILRSSEFPEHDEYYLVCHKMETKEREGSRVRRIRQEIWGSHNRECEKAGEQAYQKMLDEHKDVIRQYEKAERDVKLRRQAKTDPIYKEIAEILRSVPSGAEKRRG